jgi:hypothetical protein
MDDENRKIIIAGAVLAAVVGGGFYAYKSLNAPVPAPGLSSTPEAPAAPANPALPPLEESDDAVRRSAAGLSADPVYAAWLKQEALIQRYAAAVAHIARGAVPRDALVSLAPRGKFPVIKRGGKIYADPKGHARYDALTAAISSVDVKAFAALYAEVEPLIEEAWRGLGEKGAAREAFAAAATELAGTPDLSGDVELKEGKKGIVFTYADPKLEGLSAARKQLLRFGPKNGARVKTKLAELAEALKR